jgi:L-rhamnose isomerase
VGEVWEVREAGGRVVSVCHVDGSPRNVFERLDAAAWRLRQLLAGLLGGGGRQQRA